MRRNVIAGKNAKLSLKTSSTVPHSSPEFTWLERLRRRDTRTVALIICALIMPVLTSDAGSMLQKNEYKSEMAAAKFPRLVSEYLQDLHSRHPALAASSGFHTWDAQLEDYSPTAIAAECAAIRAFQARLEKIPPLELRLSDTMDHQILASNMNARLLELEQIKNYEHNPAVYSDVISNGLLQIAMFEYAPADSRIRHAIAKEKQIPRLLDSARLNIKGVPPIYLRVAINNFKGTLNFVQKDLPQAFASVKDPKLQKDFQKVTE